MASLYGIDEICARVGMGRTAVYQYGISTGDLRTIRIGRRRLATDEAINDFIACMESRSSQSNAS